VEFLLQAGIEPGPDILLYAISSPDPTTACRLLLQHGIRDVGGKAAAIASELGHDEAADMLAEAFEEGSSSDDSYEGSEEDEEEWAEEGWGEEEDEDEWV
jgi:hypothetical protein